MEKHLHIVTHEVPWPIDYGGVFDLFYKIKSLHQKGLKIHLHCFVSKDKDYSVLKQYCHIIHLYKRSIGIKKVIQGLPYIVASRSSKKLLENLLKDNHPIIFEGIHTTHSIYHNVFQNRNTFIRLHNVEWKYYLNLYYSESNLIKRLYYKIESILLKRYEKKIAPKMKYWSVSKEDADFYVSNFHPINIEFLPVFVPWKNLQNTTENKGNFCLYHGNLSVAENEKVVFWLIENIFSYINLPLVIAGKNPSNKLKKIALRFKNICLAENPSQFELDDLIKKAQINILPSLNSTGVKLKILNALFNGKYCIANTDAEKGLGYKGLCICSDDQEKLKQIIIEYFSTPFTEVQIENRKMLTEIYNNDKNADQIIKQLY